ncbi:Hypothetical predicted protein [Paramuricea clavata]|uniref:Uncharacterized protein n=1 Tax=Paramuricea clavata TaxID=317549 RepID=A0A7D9LGG0_PARCT|nr:Hypothetical predicted protein [Paramuricea clavata]
MVFSSKGRYFTRGMCLEESVRGEIIDDILLDGGDSETGHFPGLWSTIGAKHKVHGKTVKDIWGKFMSSGSVSPRKHILGNPSKLAVGELQLVEAMKTQDNNVNVNKYEPTKNNNVNVNKQQCECQCETQTTM